MGMSEELTEQFVVAAGYYYEAVFAEFESWLEGHGLNKDAFVARVKPWHTVSQHSQRRLALLLMRAFDQFILTHNDWMVPRD